MKDKVIDHLSKDKVLSKIIEVIPFPEKSLSKGVYADLLGSIISQQLSVKAADTINRRFLDLFDTEVPPQSALVEMDIEQLRKVGLSYQKSNYVKNVAAHFLNSDSTVNWDELDDSEIKNRLIAIKGVGEWTIQMILMFSLNRPDVFPLGDLGIRQAMIDLYKVTGEKKILLTKLQDIAAKWSPYRSYACRYLWTWKDQNKNI